MVIYPCHVGVFHWPCAMEFPFRGLRRSGDKYRCGGRFVKRKEKSHSYEYPRHAFVGECHPLN